MLDFGVERGVQRIVRRKKGADGSRKGLRASFLGTDLTVSSVRGERVWGSKANVRNKRSDEKERRRPAADEDGGWLQKLCKRRAPGLVLPDRRDFSPEIEKTWGLGGSGGGRPTGVQGEKGVGAKHLHLDSFTFLANHAPCCHLFLVAFISAPLAAQCAGQGSARNRKALSPIRACQGIFPKSTNTKAVDEMTNVPRDAATPPTFWPSGPGSIDFSPKLSHPPKIGYLEICLASIGNRARFDPKVVAVDDVFFSLLILSSFTSHLPVDRWKVTKGGRATETRL
ncbi:hypothetical protein B0T26DRAFT_203427 [Lasiosphaeria miniovina]|uniref:Uncharacterized protein n=1 Tax=Lasiosphaeria miniovina TaxID=1954250 RepID=A0AA40AUC5_9PEZI|nr:uncharacterized protein B0T26DRAFT_203427 [Lasiosphaeria miniovina]KAK0722112.1 hypothetical protein B0T26DRAFT_203427 [Lasiosphaeria miniovina]